MAIWDKLGKVVQSGTDYYKNQYNTVKGAIQSTPEQVLQKSNQGFDASKYTVDQYCYPDDLMSEVYGGNYAIFYINVGVDSKLNVTDKTVNLDPKTEPRLRSKFIAKPMTTHELATASGLTGAIEGAISGGKGGALKGAATGAISVEAAGLYAPDASRSQRRLKSAIALHIPNQLSVRYGMQWSEEDSYNLSAVSDGVLNALNKEGAKNKMSAVGKGGAEALAGIALQKAPGGVSAKLGIAANPKKEQTFKGVDYRKFTFDYQFFPRSREEARNVLNIIEQFKIHMHPEYKSENNYVYIYPSEFDITYYTSHVENQKIHRHTSCVLEELSINYTPNGNFSTFADGMPTQINVSLGFKELMLLSKETVMGGL